MRTYTVHEPPAAPRDRIDRAERLMFVRDGFSLGAALFTPFWFLARGMWLALAGWIAAVALAGLLSDLLGLHEASSLVLIAGLQLFIGLEAASLHRWSLARSGWSVAGSVVGRSLAECERRFFDAWLDGQPLIAPFSAEGGGQASPGGLARIVQQAPAPAPVEPHDEAKPRLLRRLFGRHARASGAAGHT